MHRYTYEYGVCSASGFISVCVETCLKVVVASGGLDFELESVHHCGNYPLTVARDDPQPYSKEGHGSECVCPKSKLRDNPMLTLQGQSHLALSPAPGLKITPLVSRSVYEIPRGGNETPLSGERLEAVLLGLSCLYVSLWALLEETPATKSLRGYL